MLMQFLSTLHPLVIFLSIVVTAGFIAATIGVLLGSIDQRNKDWHFGKAKRFLFFGVIGSIWTSIVWALPIPDEPPEIPQIVETKNGKVTVLTKTVKVPEIRYPRPILLYRQEMERCTDGYSISRMGKEDYDACHKIALDAVRLAGILPAAKPSFEEAYKACHGEWNMEPNPGEVDGRIMRNKRIEICGEIARKAIQG